MIVPKRAKAGNLKVWGLILACLLVSFIIGGLTGTLIHLLLSGLPLDSSVQNLLVGVASYGMVLFVLFFCTKRIIKTKDISRTFGVRGSFDRRDLIWALLGAIVYFACSWALIFFTAKLLPGFDPNAIRHYDRAQATTFVATICGLIQVAFLTPLVEELVFRGYLYSLFVGSKMPVGWAVVATSLLFAFLHYPPWVWVLDTLAFGLVAGTLRYKTKSIWPAVLMHVVVNSIGFFVLFT